MKLSVIIVNYNVQYFLEQCLRSAERAMKGIDGDIWVVDNNSVDGSMEMVRQKFPAVHRIENKTNTGFSKANNQGIVESKGEYVLLLNPDTVVEEDTFQKVVSFMDTHPEAGALGVKMIDGTGRFLPESKRGLPTPEVAFYKIFGLSALFPRSRRFGKYHLGYLDKHSIHEVDVLSGAFMLLRRSALEKVGLLDEDFFMYGEDIDLSYRIQKGGYKNYYFPETQIIHYKGESTKKTSVNYVFVFYQAMIIFARKHFSAKNASTFSFFIRMAIYLRASVAVIHRFFNRMILPVLDFLLLFAGMLVLQNYWGDTIHVHYPPIYLRLVIPAYIITWLGAVYLSGGYDPPVRFSKTVRGVATGTLMILVVYALLPEHYRFSRAMLLIGAAWASLSMAVIRILLHWIFPKQFPIHTGDSKSLLIVGNPEEGLRILSLLKMSGTQHNFIGFVSAENLSKENTAAEYRQFLLGNLENLDDILEVFRPGEVIFCAKDLSSQTIIQCMSTTGERAMEFKIAPPESLFIIGSSSIDNPGEYYTVDINRISKASNRRNKRLFDVLTSLALLVVSPVLLPLQRHPGGLFRNIFSVLRGKNTWVGFTSDYMKKGLVKPGVLHPADALSLEHVDKSSEERLNSLYAKDYQVVKDLSIVWKGRRNLGR